MYHNFGKWATVAIVALLMLLSVLQGLNLKTLNANQEVMQHQGIVIAATTEIQIILTAAAVENRKLTEEERSRIAAFLAADYKRLKVVPQ